MKKIIAAYLFTLLLWANTTAQSNNNEIVYDNTSEIKHLNYNLFILKDSLSDYKLNDVLTNNAFKLSAYSIPNLGITESSFWIKFSIYNTTSNEKLLLQLSNPLIDYADLYFKNSDNTTYSSIKLGDNRPFHQKKYKNQNFIYDVTIPQHQTKTFYLKVQSKDHILVPLTIGTKEQLNAKNSMNDIVVGFYMGIILVMFFYNSFLLITIKDINYLYYIIYIFFIGLTQIILLGYPTKLLWPNNLWLINHALFIAASVGSIAITLFMKSFLNMRVNTPKLLYGVYIIVGIYILAILATITEHQNISYPLIDVNGLFVAILSISVAIITIIKGYKPAKYYLIGWVVFLVGVFVFVLRNFGYLPYNNFTNYMMPAGSAIEVALLSFALADRINILKREKAESQALALEALKQNELIITNQNILLEKNVSERTIELKQTNSELVTTLTELKHTQSQLIGSEKLASLGQLTAGIAHEINNPINFVVSNVKPLKRDIDDLYELIRHYEILSKTIESNPKLDSINQFKNEIDYTFIQEEINNLLKGIEDGASRTAEIVKGLRVFSNLDENELNFINISDSINSTLTLLNSEISESIELVKNFGPAPEIKCYSGKIHHVFMNLLNNAIFAIKEHKSREEKGQLIITTYADKTHVFVSIKDNGIGMKKDILQKIFDPFFTTKKTGIGTGLGLSITKSVITEHHGTIEVHSVYEKGSEFIVALPIFFEK